MRCWGRGAAAPVELPEIVNAVGLDVAESGAIYVVTADGRVLRSGSELMKLGPLEVVPEDGEAIDVSVLGDTPLVLMRGGELEGRPRLTDVNAVQIDGARGLALHRDGRVTAFTAAKATSLPIKDLEAFVGFGCGRRRSGELACWDARGKSKPWKGPANIVERVAGERFGCDLTRSGVSCTGWNDVGQLGTGREPDRMTPRLVDLPGKPIGLAASGRSACALLDSGELACWGANDAGQLGDGTRRDHVKPIIVSGASSATLPAPTDGLKDIEQATDEMSWADLPAACKRPTKVAGLETIASAIAHLEKDGGSLWFADFRLQPGGYRGRVARHGQHAVQLRLTGKGGITRGRYQSSGARRSSMIIHDESGAKPTTTAMDLVIESADKTWICGQLLDKDPAKRQPFAARVEKRVY
ncbi:MAG: hypothetical protein H0T46_33820 [Deltaproteobacteria bacterium]|nr:hypothetical protein [Deltaproteobacteria bacterium]